jgi:hypothetical protein
VGAAGACGIETLVHILLKGYVISKYFGFPYGLITQGFHVLIIGAVFIAQKQSCPRKGGTPSQNKKGWGV